MDYVLTAPKVFNRMRQLDKLSFGTHILKEKDSVVIDLSNITFIKPLGVIGILLLVESIMKQKSKVKVSIKPPTDEEVLDYLLKVNFVQALQSLGKWKIPEGIKASGRKIKQ